jgi:hypothetical protein
VPRFATALHWTRLAAYVLLAASGIFSVVRPPVAVAAAASHTIGPTAWAILLSASSLCCAYGAATDKWIGEYVGLAPLGFSVAAFSVAAFARGGPSLAGGLFLSGFFFFLITRWQEVTILRIKAQYEAEERARQTGAP